ncbi:MAG: carbohydrate-binding protein, partial [Rhizobiaceae bacterium]|nr:carbohydrate-binding protein [Rhizobiaceae bacterium]
MTNDVTDAEAAATGAVPDWFRTPGPEFRPSVFWFWHAIPSEASMRDQLADMAGKGIGAVMVQARLALPIAEYLSPAYLAALRFACVEAGRVGLKVTLYDEYNWMSGHGGGRTVEGADHLRERHLFWTRGKMAGDGVTLTVSGIVSPFLDFLGEVGRNWAYEGGAPAWGEWRIVAAVSTGDDGTVRDITPNASLTDMSPDGCAILVAPHASVADGADVTVFVAARCLTSRMVNYLLPEAAERFAEKVYAPLLDAAGGEAEAFFFDHPYAGFYVWNEHFGDLGNSLLWDEVLPCLLADRASLGETLLALTRDIGPRTASLRAGFFAAYQMQMHEAFFGTLSRWTTSRGVGFTGHELLTHVGAWGLQEGLAGFDPRTMPGVDPFGVDAKRTTTTVDAADFEPQLSAKLGDCVARANGRRRCTVEQYATGREVGRPGLAGQWGLTLESFRAQAIRHVLLGARQILLHSYNASYGTDGNPRLLLNPRFDFPPGYNFEPWWEDCPGVFDELARLAAFLEEGEPLWTVALLHPLETIRAEATSPDCGRHFGWWAEALSRAGIGYDILDEARLSALLTPPDGAGASRLTTLILPAVTTLESCRSAHTIARFATAGGKVLASGPLPDKTRERGSDTDVAALFADLRARGALTHLPDAGKPEVTAAVETI